MRTPLVDGWFLVTDDVLLQDPPNVAALRAHFADPDAWLVRLEGPGNMIATFPFENYEEALSVLRIPRRPLLRKKPGPTPRVTLQAIGAAIDRLAGDDATSEPKQKDVADALGTSVRYLAAQHEGVPWRVVVDARRALRDHPKEWHRRWRARRRPTGYERGADGG